uniref:Uncharacterized protein n=1 Tax=Salix viminalis TaxID=40686 RepID=A0A6N2NLW4_SALVM
MNARPLSFTAARSLRFNSEALHASLCLSLKQTKENLLGTTTSNLLSLATSDSNRLAKFTWLRIWSIRSMTGSTAPHAVVPTVAHKNNGTYPALMSFSIASSSDCGDNENSDENEVERHRKLEEGIPTNLTPLNRVE